MSGAGDRDRLERIFRAALAAADPSAALRRSIECDASGLRIAGESLSDDPRLHVLGVGKAAAPMAATLEQIVGSRMVRGLVVTKDGHGVPLARSQLREAAHPVPDVRSADAGREAIAFAASVPPEDVLLVLLSGGASSLLSCPAAGLGVDDLAATTRLLLASGAPIDQLNIVRKHLSATAGGQLALASAAHRSFVLAVSDVPDDRIDWIGSGPFAPDPSTWADAIEVLVARGVWSQTPGPVRDRLRAGARGELPRTPGDAAAALARVRHQILASNRTALEAARRAAASEGTAPFVLAEELAGEARVVGSRIGALLTALRPSHPICLLFGGETTVTLRGGGRGGRSQELALAAARAIEGRDGAGLLAAGTDGSDGPTDAAGAFADGGTVARGGDRGRDARVDLENNGSYEFFEAEGGLLRTGPTGTNVRDLVIASARPGSG